MATLLEKIKSGKSDMFRRVLIKRRNLSSGLFESSWQDISKDVKSFGKFKLDVDSSRLYKFTFSNAKIVMSNSDGLYNPHDSESSLWYNYLNQQRTLVKIEAGYIHRILNANGSYTNTELPSQSLYDVSNWDSGAMWDATTSSIVFTGVINGDISTSDKNEVTFNLKPLVSIFQDYPAKNLTGWTSTGMTASQFLAMVRDQTDGSGNFVFRPFFGDTTSNFYISTTTNVYANLNTSTAEDVIDSTVWEIIEKLSESENYIPYVTRDGSFRFTSRDANTTVSAFEFHGAGSYNSEYGHTIKAISSYGRKISKYYSRVQIKFKDENTSTSYVFAESDFTVGPASNPWILGHRTFQLQNLFMATSTVAQPIATAIFNDYSSLKNEIEFTTTFVPHLDILDRIRIYYDPSEITPQSLWDLYNWADSSTITADLLWDGSVGKSMQINGQEFKFLSIELDVDNFETKFQAREV